MEPNDSPAGGMHEGEEAPPPGVRTAAIVRWAIIAFVTLVALWSVSSSIGLFSRGSHVTSGGKTGDVYQCPMHPSIVSDRPGDCPICNMTLQKVSGQEDEAMTSGTSQVPGLATVTFTDDKIQKSGVCTARATKRMITDPVRTVALLTADESRVAKVQTRFSGWVERLPVSETGTKVTKGQVLAEIYSPELFTAQQEFLTSTKWAVGGPALSQDLGERARQRLELLGVSAADLAAIEKAGTPLKTLPVRAPIAGHVTFKGAVEGVFVAPGTELFEIANLDRVWAWAEVYERDLARVEVGRTATLRVESLPDRTFTGKVTFLQPTIDPQSRTLRARVEVPNAGLVLRPGMYGEVEIASEPREGLSIPRDALVDTGEHQYVFVEVSPMRFQPRLVEVGARGDEVIVLSGLSEGETVVTSGNFLVDSESRRRAIARSSSATATQRSDVPISREKFPEKYEQWLECERVHRGMGSMAEDCQSAIPKPWSGQ